jgi:hypothetical protein
MLLASDKAKALLAVSKAQAGCTASHPSIAAPAAYDFDTALPILSEVRQK